MSAELVPFGKYKGQPIEVLAADTDYCEWLTAQPWFKSRYLNVYNTIINYGGEPQDSPEHNQMQAAFLDDHWCFALADLLYPRRKGTYGESAARELLDGDPMYEAFQGCFELEVSSAEIAGRRFEDRGWDVVYGVQPADIAAHRKSLVPPLPACTCRCDHSRCTEASRCHTEALRQGYCLHERCKEKRGIDSSDHCMVECYWSRSGPLTHQQREWLKTPSHWYGPDYHGMVRVEIKPDLGDDYPTVLRQVCGYYHDGPMDRRCVVARRHAFEHVTWEQVKKIFAASKIDLLAESEITP